MGGFIDPARDATAMDPAQRSTDVPGRRFRGHDDAVDEANKVSDDGIGHAVDNVLGVIAIGSASSRW